MKVAMLATTGESCGIAAYTRHLLEPLSELVDVELEPIQPGRQPDAHYREQAARLNQADVIHIQHEHSFWGSVLPGGSAFWVLRYLLHRPVVVTAHTTYSVAELLRVATERRLLHRLAKEVLIRRPAYRDSVEIAPFATARCIVHTDEGRRALIARGAVPAHVHTIPPGIAPPLPAPTGGKAFRERFRLAGRPVVSLFGFLAPSKGYEVALEALAGLPPEVALVFAGGPRTEDMAPYADQLRARIAAAGLEGRVRITGFLPDEQVAEAMAASDIVIAPHTQATGSYSVTVPMAHGKPIVASDQACFVEACARIPCLRIVPTGDAAALRQALAELLQSPEERDRLSRAAAEYARTHSWEAAARRTVEVYQLALADAGRPAPLGMPSA